MSQKIEGLLEEINNKLNAVITSIALKEKDRENQVKILKSAGLKQNQILNIIGISETTKRTRKHREKKDKENSQESNSEEIQDEI